MWECEVCGTEQELDANAEEGQIVECEECSAEYEIMNLDPLELTQLDIADTDDDDSSGDDDDEDWGDD